MALDVERQTINAEINALLRSATYEWAKGIADIVCEVLGPLCERVEIVGSIRRGKHDPGDVDVLVATGNGLSVCNLIDALEKVADRSEVVFFEKAALITFSIEGLKCDVIVSYVYNWGKNLIQFTGSRKFKEIVFGIAERRGYEVKNGVIGRTSYNGYSETLVPVMDGKSEEEILRELGLTEFIDPTLRDFE